MKPYLFGIIVFMICIVPLISYGEQEEEESKALPSMSRIKEQLYTEDDLVRDKTFRRLITAYPQLSAEEQKKISHLISEVLDRPVEKGEVWNDSNTPRNLACYVAGEIRLEEAIPFLIKLLKPRTGQVVSGVIWAFPQHIDGENIGYAAKALIKIGVPAKSMLEEALVSTRDDGLKKVINYIMDAIEGKKHIPRERGKHLTSPTLIKS